MNGTELYDELAVYFPALWPQSPNWTWINVHDGQNANVKAISELVDRTFALAEVVVLVHAEPGVATRLSRKEAANYVAQFVLKHEVQVSDSTLSRFVSVSLQGVATNDA
ncbi:hypothetical protein [Polaromonas sp.]|uniref:hypothetical protein n=1 Tax=Polaromonas sp. TaxID=1869339 RepID=UPI003265A891